MSANRLAGSAIRAASGVLDLPRPTISDVAVEQDLRVPTADGVVLLADRYIPVGVASPPTVLVRSPYGRRGVTSLLFGRLFAHQGFTVVVQSCRGRFGSGGDFEEPMLHEADDGRATLEWLRRQPWFDGRVATLGPSYLGYVQWALADAAPELSAMVVQVGPHGFRDVVYPGGAFALEDLLGWAQLVTGPDREMELATLAMPARRRRLHRAVAQAPLRTAYRSATGGRVAFFEQWVDHEAPEDPWWDALDHEDAVGRVEAPVLLQTGWWDLFLGHSVEQYRALRDRGVDVHLTIGPWHHLDITARAWPAVMNESVAWLRAAFSGDRTGLRSRPVRIYDVGARSWVELDDWPPPSAHEEHWHLHPDGRLDRSPAPRSAPSRHSYDPADPTPSVGGATISPTAGSWDNRRLESRDDVLTFSSEPLGEDLEVCGPVRVELWVGADVEHLDVFARLCDVDPRGRSRNLGDGILRLTPERSAPEPDGTRRAAFDLSPVACRFRRRHRIRLQVSGGAHPRFLRNSGSGEPIASATQMVASQRAVHHDPEHPSGVTLSVVGRPPAG